MNHLHSLNYSFSKLDSDSLLGVIAMKGLSNVFTTESNDFFLDDYSLKFVTFSIRGVSPLCDFLIYSSSDTTGLAELCNFKFLNFLIVLDYYFGVSEISGIGESGLFKS